jgi:hypothetical protein
MRTLLGIRERSIPCAVALAGLSLAASPVALAKDARPLAAAAPPASVPPVAAAAPAPAPAPRAAAAPAPAPPAVTAPQLGCACSLPYTHDGFYLRLALGGGGGATSGAGTKYSGGSFVFDSAFGGALTEHLILYGEFLFHNISKPSGSPKAGDPTLVGNPVDNFGLGAGVAYYFMPLNLYLSGSLLLQKVLLTKTYAAVAPNGPVSSKEFTNTGLGLNFMVGKEWWASDEWGLGVAAQLFLASAKDRDGKAEWSSWALALLFTATHN